MRTSAGRRPARRGFATLAGAGLLVLVIALVVGGIQVENLRRDAERSAAQADAQAERLEEVARSPLLVLAGTPNSVLLSCQKSNERSRAIGVLALATGVEIDRDATATDDCAQIVLLLTGRRIKPPPPDFVPGGAP